jgi:hypothetical protein
MDNTLGGEFILNADEADSKPAPSAAAKAAPTIKKSKPHFYTAFWNHPMGVSFAEQEAGEEIILILRRHFVTNFPWIVFAIILSILPIFYPILIAFFPFPLPSGSTLGLITAFYYLLIFGFLLTNFTLWYFHIGIVTNLRVVDIDLDGILYRQVTEAKIENIEDVTYRQIGFITSLFNYGNVIVQTAGAEENIEYDRVPKPSQVADIIGDLSQQS